MAIPYPKKATILGQKLLICTTGPIFAWNIYPKGAKNYIKASSLVWAQDLKFWDLAHGL